MIDIWANPALLILLGAIPSLTVAILAHRRSGSVAKTTEQSQIVTNQTAGVNQVIDAMDQHTKNLQEDNRLLREGIGECRLELQKIIQQLAIAIDDVAVMRRALAKDIDDNPRY